MTTQAITVLDAIDRPIKVGDYLTFMVGSGVNVRVGKVLDIVVGKLQQNYWNQAGYQIVKIKTLGLPVYSLTTASSPPRPPQAVSNKLTSSWEAGRLDAVTAVVKATSALLCTDAELIQAFEDTL